MSRLLFIVVLLLSLACASNRQSLQIQTDVSVSDVESLAAKELQRYIRLCSGELPAMHVGDIPKADILLTVQGSALDQRLTAVHGVPNELLSEQGYALHTIDIEGRRVAVIRGGSPVGTLYGAYRFIEALGVRFYLHDDVLPEKTPFVMPELHLVESPQFELRGIQPFHDFPEGPDWWNLDDYKAVMSQLAKMRMNFIGFHTYPSIPFNGHSRPEPMVWHGTVEQLGADGSVRSGYPVLHFHTGDSTWGYFPMRTSDYAFGAAQLFDADDFGADYMKNVSPWPHSEAENLNIFNTFGAWQKDMFTYAHRLGVKTCVGTETPLNIPAEVQAQLKAQGMDPHSEPSVQAVYEGTFERLKRLHPLDYYWFWTPEYWTWQEVPDSAVVATERDMLIAAQAAQAVAAPFTLATCGWVLGPPQDRAQFDRTLPKEMPFSCINREVGFTPVDSNFARMNERPTWAVSWLEDDPALISPQLWVGRTRRDAVDALAYGCVGFMGIHWRTEILSPAMAATAQLGWSFGDWQKAIDPTSRDLPVDDFYLDWATANFGRTVGAEAAAVFARLDGGPLFVPGKNQRQAHLYRTSDWANRGPGGILINPRPWSEVQKQFEFLGELEALREKIIGAAQLERFDYWLNTFRYNRAAAQVGCLLGEYDVIANEISRGKQAETRGQAALKALALKGQIEQAWGEMVTLHLLTVNTPGALGTIANLEQHNLLNLRRIDRHDSLLTAVLGALPPSGLWKDYRGETRLIVPTRRSILEKGEPLRLQAMVLSAAPAEAVTLFWRPLGKKSFKQQPCRPVARSVYRIQLSAAEMGGDIEYYLQARADGKVLTFPITAPATNRTVIVW